MTRRLTFVFTSLVLFAAACGDSSPVEKDAHPYLPVSDEPFADLSGRWQESCSSGSSFGQGRSQRMSVEVKGDKLKWGSDTYGTTDCGGSPSLRTRHVFKILNATGTTYPRHLDLEYVGFFVTPLTEERVLAYVGKKETYKGFCGTKEWKLKEALNVTGTPCFPKGNGNPEAGTAIYTIYDVDGDNLQLGAFPWNVPFSDEHTTLKPSLRPKKLLPAIYDLKKRS